MKNKDFPSFLSIISCLIVALFFYQSLNAQQLIEGNKPRVIVLTDISSLKQNEGEPDDGQSMVRLMLYTNELDIEGLIATSNLGHGQVVRPDLIRQVVQAYGEVRPNLLLHDSSYPPASDLLNLIFAGQPVASPKVPVFQSIGEGRDTDGSEWIIKMADKKEQRPLWIIIWGGSADLAQALWKVSKNRTPDQLKKFLSKIRVDACGDQDATGPWIKSKYPDLYHIFRTNGIRGMYRGGDTTLVRSGWIKENMRHHGALGDLYVDYRGGDIWSSKLGKVMGIKEGDSPLMLSLFSNGLNVPDKRNWGSWGGRFETLDGNVKRWVDAIDSVGNYKTDPNIGMAAVYRWRSAWQADFTSRLDWCIKPFSGANHAPVVSPGPKFLKTTAGKTVKLKETEIKDPDDNALTYKWYFYPEASHFSGKLPVLNSTMPMVSFIAPEVSTPENLHVILEITDNGVPALTRYKRFILTINNKK